MAKSEASAEDLARIYGSLYLVRRTEEEVARIYPSDRIKSPVHLSIGQESVSAGVCDAMRPNDVVSATYRSHAAYRYAALRAGGVGGRGHYDSDRSGLRSRAEVRRLGTRGCGLLRRRRHR